MKVKVYYAPINNMGDDLNRLLMEKVFKQQLDMRIHINDFDIMGIGSCLGNCFYNKDMHEAKLKLFAKKMLSKLSGTGHVWGTGFIQEYPFESLQLIRNNIQFDIVRGELSRRGVSKVIGHELDVPLADGGLLAPMLIQDKKINKCGKIGIIPHYREKENQKVLELMKCVGEEAVLIDVQHDSIEVIEQIASCDYVISSSLHGLIVADAFNVPNTRIKITDNLLGTGFKFDDYYSSYGMEKKPIIISDKKTIDRGELFEQPQVSYEQVKQKQKVLVETMNRILNL